MSLIYTSAVLREVLRERANQDAKWGEQNVPLGTGDVLWLGHSEDNPPPKPADIAELWKSYVDSVKRRNVLTFWDILFEEVLEVNAETDPAKVRAELVQVAAVAVAMIERIDRGLAARVKCEGFELGDGNTSGCDPSGGSDCPVCGGSGWSDRGGL